MRTAPKIIIASALAILLLIGGLTAAVAAVTKPVKFAPKRAVLSAVGTVELLKSSGDWQKIEGETEVAAGDEIRTGSDGRAEINYFDQGVARLDANTSVKLDALNWQRSQPTKFVGGVRLETGRIWSRLFDFLSPESAYEVRTATTVATIRGTSFYVKRTPQAEDSIYVATHRVSVSVAAEAGQKEVRVAAGETATIQPKKGAAEIVVEKKELPDDDKIWAEQNIDRDKKFDQLIREKNLKEAKALRPIDPSSPLHWFVGAAEGLQLAFTFDEAKKEELADNFAAGRFLDAYIAIEAGDAETARAMINEAKNFIAEDDKSEAGEELAAVMTYFVASDWDSSDIQLIEEIKDAAPIYADSLENTAAIRLEYGEVFTEAEDDGGAAQPTTVSADGSTLTEAEPAKTSADNETISPTPTEAETSGTESRTEILPAPQPTTSTATETAPEQISESSSETLKENAEFQPAPVISAAIPTALDVRADALNITAGDSVALHAAIVWSDGRSEDVSSQVSWHASPDDVTGKPVGVMRGSVFTSYATGGKTVITAIYRSDDIEFSDSVTITALPLELFTAAPL